MNALHQPFFQHALLAGTAIALASGLVGYFLVLRAQTFTGDTLSHVAFTGAMAALAGGYDLRLGLFAATVGAALLLGALGRRGRPDDVVIGTLFSWILGLGTFFLTLYATHRGADRGNAGISVLFGSVYGLDGARAATAAAIAALIAAAVLLIARPLLFATLDDAVAAARGVRTGTLGLVFLALVGACAAEATQAVGSLLLLGLLAAPAGTAVRLTDRLYRALALSAALAVLEMWAGLALSVTVPRLPPSFSIMAVATACYAAALPVRPQARARPAVRPAGPSRAPGHQ
ncbi:zinc/manganese transport system permease protein [Kitasatospora sp. SolWspMP-SS2h]|uniref:metal ABC transporter permease n=1 Tax=Kitasatospora sp. SolWspMP-SS2h TaxID=1305729 RepID=UPI000DB9D50B|nr:metal ABC transporter permease [Kitasatospora sp. SolWspMP-SS2h]RAJ38486.1 zinc/manganese transport system permease protein [Kitasatospora sp. SolWspMP-SS2h]